MLSQLEAKYLDVVHPDQDEVFTSALFRKVSGAREVGAQYEMGY